MNKAKKPTAIFSIHVRQTIREKMDILASQRRDSRSKLFDKAAEFYLRSETELLEGIRL